VLLSTIGGWELGEAWHRMGDSDGYQALQA
jgi:hypothetical protein